MKLRNCILKGKVFINSNENEINCQTPTKRKLLSPTKEKSLASSTAFPSPTKLQCSSVNPDSPQKSLLSKTNSSVKTDSPTKSSAKSPAKTPSKSPAKTPSKSFHESSDICTPVKRILSFDLKTPKKASPFSATKALFYRSTKPLKLEAREKEREILEQFLQQKVQKYLPCSMYISGNPGTGKSALVEEFLEEKKSLFRKNNIHVVKINCMSVKEVKKIYHEIVVELGGIKLDYSPAELNSSTAYELIRQCIGDEYLLLVLDEVDSLARSSDNHILYGLFDWSVVENSNIGIIAIANSLDFTDRTLPRLMSKNGKCFFINSVS